MHLDHHLSSSVPLTNTMVATTIWLRFCPLLFTGVVL